MVGGNFTEDALGPRYKEVLARLHSAPSAYLDTFERLFVARPVAASQLSKLYLAAFLQRLAGAAPDRVGALAGHFLGQVNTATQAMELAAHEIGELDAQPQELTFAAENLEIRRREFRRLSRMKR
jgi:hypothetical protein